MKAFKDYLLQFEPNLIYGIVIAIFVLLLGLLLLFFQSRHERDTRKMIELLDWFEVQGMGAVLSVFSLTTAFLLIWAGWRIPSEIAQIFGQTDGSRIFPLVTDSWVGRLAQIIGATSFAIIAFRGLRFFLPVFLVLAIAALIIAGYDYVIGL